MKLIVITIFFFFTINICSIFAMKFEPDKMADPQKMAAKLVNEKLKSLKKNGVKKVIIINCQGQYLAEKSVAPGAWEGKDMTIYQKKEATHTTSVTYNQEYLVDLTTQVKDKVKQLLIEAGFEVADDAEWMQHPVYQEMEKIMESYDEDKSTKYGMISSTETIRTIKVPAYNMRLVPDGVLSMLKYTRLSTQKMGKILEDTNSQAFCRIELSVGYGASFRPDLRALNIYFDSGLKKYDAGTKDKDGNKEYIYSVPDMAYVAMKDILEYQNKEYNGKYFQPPIYKNILMEMVDYILNVYRPILKETTSEYLK